ncbi:MAG TPA: metal-dependent hydrolase [Thermoanaerobaculia bacterium]|nr:metal-dependent hydrolase [Thermoanaerobaculia bacterium]
MTNQHPRPSFTWLGHATVRCNLPGGEVVLIDPWVMGNPACPDSLKRFDRMDAMLISHAHSDHMGDAVELAKRHRPRHVVGCYEICTWLQSKGIENCQGMNLGGSQELLGLTVSMVRADHSCGLLDGDHVVYGGVAAGFVVKLAGGFTFYHAGDTALFSDMQLIAELYRPELAFLPIGDLYTMDPQQAARACRYLNVRKVVPIHWGTFAALTGTPQKLVKALEDLGVACEVVALQPGDTY